MTLAPLARATTDVPVAPIDGIPVSRLGFRNTLDLLDEWLGQGRPRRIATANLDFLTQARESPELRLALRTADLVTADGMPLVLLSRWSGHPVAGRVAGADLVPALVERAARSGHSVFLLGGRPGSAESAANALLLRWPTLRLAGIEARRFELEDAEACEAIADRVRESGADLLLVALGCPKQEVFLNRYLSRCGCQLGVGVGATLDFLAGDVRRAPRWIASIGLEWLFRMLNEPRRLAGRYARNARHLALIVRDRVTQRLGLSGPLVSRPPRGGGPGSLARPRPSRS